LNLVHRAVGDLYIFAAHLQYISTAVKARNKCFAKIEEIMRYLEMEDSELATNSSLFYAFYVDWLTSNYKEANVYTLAHQKRHGS